MARRVLEWFRRFSPELYFFLYNGAIVFILPYLAILWRENGLTGSQIGMLSCFKPFICSISGQLLVGVADSRRWHFRITIVTYLITLAARSSMALATGFVAHMLLILASEACQSPFSIITDAAIAAATDEAGYGRKRVLASLGWGALAPLSGWIVGRYGVPHSIAVYFGLVTAALLPTLLLPIKELAIKRGASAEQEVDPGSAARKKAGHLGRSSAALLLPGGSSNSSSGDLDSRQHNGHAAELAIEFFSVPVAAEVKQDPAAGDALLDRLNSKLAQAEMCGQAPDFALRPLLTTADEDAEEEAATTARAAAAGTPSAIAAPGQDEDSWSIAAVGSPLAAQRSSLPPIACPQGASPAPSQAPAYGGPGQGWSGTPHNYGSSGFPSALARTTSAGMGTTPLGRTTSAATTAFFSVKSNSSLSAMAGGSLSAMAGGGALLSPRGEVPRGLPRPALFRQQSDAASRMAASTPRAIPGAGLQRQQSALQHQVSNISQALNGFDLSILEGSMSDGTFLTPRKDSTLPPQLDSPPAAAPAAAGPAEPGLEAVKAGLLGLPEVHTVHPPHFLDLSSIGHQQTDASDRQLRRRTSSRFLLPVPGGQENAKPLLPAALASLPAATQAADVAAWECAKRPLLLDVDAGCSAKGAGLPAVEISVGGSSRGGDAAAAAAANADPTAKRRADLSVWGGIKQLLSNPHHAAFFATTFLMGIGYGFLGYENLYLKESGAPGLLIGLSLTVSTCGEIPLFATSGWWLPKLGHDLAFNIGMGGWVVRLALYTLLPLFPTMWCVLPVELLQGLTFAMAYGVGTVHAKSIAPPHLRSTVQSMFFCLYYGVGPGISGLVGGIVYGSMGMRWVFIIGSSTLAVGWAVIQLVLRWATRHEHAERAAAAELAI